MKLTLFIGPHESTAMRIRALLQHYSKDLAAAGVEVPKWNHVRLYTAAAAPEAISALRHRRGLDHPLTPSVLRAEFRRLFARDLAQMRGDHVVLAAAQIGSLLWRPEEAAELAELLSPVFNEVRLIALVQEQARALLRHYEQAILDGRQTSLATDLAHATPSGWSTAIQNGRAPNAPDHGIFEDLNTAPHWVDYKSLLSTWDKVFGSGSTVLAPLDIAKLYGPRGGAFLFELLDLPATGPNAPASFVPKPISAAALTRMRHMNVLLERYSRAKDIFIPHEVRGQLRQAVQIGGPPIDPGGLSALSEHFLADNQDLIGRFPALAPALRPDPPSAPWTEADPRFGFRASQYLTAYAHAIDRVSIPLARRRAEIDKAAQSLSKFKRISDAASTHSQDLVNRVQVHHRMILTSDFRPHNRLGRTASEAEPFPTGASHAPTGTVIIACMKNEAPYILEWIAHHLSIGVDHFLIYTNGCSDGTNTLLKALEKQGVVTHRTNEDWTGKSPQQFALNRALDEPVVQAATWLAHIDVDEFINVRAGDGTLSAFFDAVPQASHVAMTWRLFGHNKVTQLLDALVLEQFDRCAPAYCPKPHTAWGFKTLFRNIGAYGKLSCHRPNKLREAAAGDVVWVNGSGQTITNEVLRNGWRSSRSSIGYDLLQLNHYPLRSAEAFLVKRDRGRALHVDRTIGLNYWIRMDWSDCHDTSIQRNLARLKACRDMLLADPDVRRAHQNGFAWHKAKAAVLRADPEFAQLFAQICDITLSADERAAFALALDTES